MVNFKEFFENYTNRCSESSILELIKKFRENVKNKSLSDEDKYLPIQMIIDCLQEHSVDNADLEKLHYYFQSPYTSRGTPNTAREKDQGILYLLDKYEKATAHHGTPSFKIPHDPNKPSYFVFVINNMPTRYVVEPLIRGSGWVESKYGDKLDVALKIPVEKIFVKLAESKNESIGELLKSEEFSENDFTSYLELDWNKMDVEVYYSKEGSSNGKRTARNVLLPTDTLRRGLDVENLSEEFLNNFSDYVYRSLQNNDYVIINDTGVKHA